MIKNGPKTPSKVASKWNIRNFILLSKWLLSGKSLVIFFYFKKLGPLKIAVAVLSQSEKISYSLGQILNTCAQNEEIYHNLCGLQHYRWEFSSSSWSWAQPCRHLSHFHFSLGSSGSSSTYQSKEEDETHQREENDYEVISLRWQI